jgi:deoxyhypusine synthase
MTHLNIAQQRLHNQLITRQNFEKAEDVMRCLCAAQAQDYTAAKWALGLRMQNSTDSLIGSALRKQARSRKVGPYGIIEKG